MSNSSSHPQGGEVSGGNVALTVNRHDPATLARIDTLLNEGKTGKEIADDLGCSRSTVELAITENPSTLGHSRTRARAILADRLVEEGQTILDAPLPAENAGPEATRAKNRADFRWKRAAAEDRPKYGEPAKQEVSVNVTTLTFDLAALLPTPAPLAAPLTIPALPSVTTKAD